MSDEILSQPPAVFSSKERAALVARALSEAARRARFSTKRRRTMASGGVRQRRGVRLLQLLKIWTFFGIVALPSAVFAGYMFLIATPQFTADARFTVRGGIPPTINEMGQLSGGPSMLIVQDTQVLLQYIVSRAMVENLNKTVNYERLFEDPSVDWLSRLKSHQAIENVVSYWKKHVSLTVELPSGIVLLSVKAFSPDDAVQIANAVLEASEQLVNQMNDKMRQDAVTLAQSERQRAETNLATARANLERARNHEGILSASEQSKSMTNLIEKVQGQMIKMQQDYDAQHRFIRADAPQLRNLQTKIDAAQKEVDSLKAQITRSGPSSGDDRPVLSGSMSRLDHAQLESTIAEQIYGASLAGFEQAHLASENKLMYINTFVQPVAAQQAEYPKRGLDTLIFALAALGVWLGVVGGLTLARNMV